MSQSIQTLPSALAHAEQLFRSCKGKSLVIFLDYDGTLTPIVARPDLARLCPEMRNVLQALAHQCPVAIISGRDRLDVARLVNLDMLYYAGSHGFDIAGPHGWQIQHEVGAHFLPDIDRAEKDLRQQLQGVNGALIERKRFSVAVHYRLVEAQDFNTVKETIHDVLAHHLNLRKTEGKMVYELRPNVDWDKGKAVLWILNVLHVPQDQILPFYLGDDLTDEDAFKVLQDTGVGIVVDDSFRSTCAQYALNHPGEVQTFLDLLVNFLRDRTP